MQYNFTLYEFSITYLLTAQTEANKYSHMEVMEKQSTFQVLFDIASSLMNHQPKIKI